MRNPAFLLVPLALLAALPAAAQEPLSLADAVTRAARGTAPVQVATLRTREAESRVGQARSALLPGVGGTASEVERTYNSLALGLPLPSSGAFALPTLVGPVKAFDARFRATQTLFDLSSWVRVRSAREGVETSRAEQTGASETAASGAAQAYLRAARAAAVVSARQADLDIAEALVSLAEAQIKAGTAADIDLVRARTQTATSRGQLLVARNQAERAALDLARALGAPPDARFALSDTLSSAIAAAGLPTSPDSAIAIALERRPELEAERARRARAAAERTAINAERLPRLDLAADWGVSGVRASDAIPTRQWALQVSLPLLDGLRRESRLAEQSAVARESEVRERDLRDQVATEVRAALLDVSSGLELEGIARERVSLAEQELSQARERFVNGVAGNIEVINAQSSMVRARDALIDARAATATARINLAKATGLARDVR